MKRLDALREACGVRAPHDAIANGLLRGGREKLA
jgi:hypothetical protein